MTITFYDAVTRERLCIATQADGVPHKGDRVKLLVHRQTSDDTTPLPQVAEEYLVDMVVWQFSGGLFMDYSRYSSNLDRVDVYLDPVQYPYSQP